MGNLRFHYSDTDRVDPRAWQTAYITGIEGVPWQCRHQLQSDQFIIGRELDESGKVNIVWPSASSGNLCLATGSLRETQSPYGLAMEIARGTMGRLKNQTDEWQRMGLKLPDEFSRLADDGLNYLLQCLTVQGDLRRLEELAQKAIDQSTRASTILGRSFSQQALASRRHHEGPLTTLLGVNLPPTIDLAKMEAQMLRAFNLVMVQPDLGRVEQASGNANYTPFDDQVDWASQNNVRLGIGPSVDFRPERLPHWMILLGEDYQSILQSACQHVENTVHRYRNRAQLWNCAAGLTTPTNHHWTEEQVLRLAVAVISTVRRTDNRTPVLLTIDQPWSEYLRDTPDGISPLHFADALIRADLGLSGLALELAFDAWPGGSFPRDLIEVSRMVDRWAMLGLPLVIHLSSTTQAPDGNGTRVHDWQFQMNGASPGGIMEGFIPPAALVQLLISKPAVHAVIWNQMTDQGTSSHSFSGIWNRDGNPKQLLSELAAIRKAYLL